MREIFHLCKLVIAIYSQVLISVTEVSVANLLGQKVLQKSICNFNSFWWVVDLVQSCILLVHVVIYQHFYNFLVFESSRFQQTWFWYGTHESTLSTLCPRWSTKRLRRQTDGFFCLFPQIVTYVSGFILVAFDWWWSNVKFAWFVKAAGQIKHIDWTLRFSV